MRFHASLLVTAGNSSPSEKEHSQFSLEKCIFHFLVLHSVIGKLLQVSILFHPCHCGWLKWISVYLQSYYKGNVSISFYLHWCYKVFSPYWSSTEWLDTAHLILSHLWAQRGEALGWLGEGSSLRNFGRLGLNNCMAIWPRSCCLGLKDDILWVLSHNAYTELSVGPISILLFLVKWWL